MLTLFGIYSDLYLGDETFHFRYATYMFQTHSRPLYDPLFGFSEEGRIYYVAGPLWATLLASIWTVTGGISQTTAQLYQVMYFVSLVILTGLLAKNFYGKQVGLYSAIIICTMPMVPVFSIILHTDLPIAVFSVLCFYLLTKKKFFWAGLVLGLAFLTKRNIYLLTPFLIFLVPGEDIKDKARNLFRGFVPFCIVTIPDFYFRYTNFGFDFLYHFKRISPLEGKYINIIERFVDSPDSPKYVFYDQDNILYEPTALITRFGIVFWVALLSYFITRKHNKKDWSLWLLISGYTALFLYFFRGNYAIRYLLPIIPFLCVIAAVGFTNIKSKFIRYILILGCITQLLYASVYTFYQRTIPPGLEQTYSFIKTYTPEDSCIMTTKNSLSLHTGRRSMWGTYGSLVEIGYLFWDANEQEALEILIRYKITHLLVEKDRIYDDTKIIHLGGYPKSFVQKIQSWKCFRKIFENDEIVLWELIKV
ncbi:MAG: glycosyltransferase family 39 protein [bacterium]